MLIMGFKSYLANKIMSWLSENADDVNEAQVDMKGQSISIKTLKAIEQDWINSGIIR